MAGDDVVKTLGLEQVQRLLQAVQEGDDGGVGRVGFCLDPVIPVPVRLLQAGALLGLERLQISTLSLHTQLASPQTNPAQHHDPAQASGRRDMVHPHDWQARVKVQRDWPADAEPHARGTACAGCYFCRYCRALCCLSWSHIRNIEPAIL